MTETQQQHLIRSTFREVDRISQVFALTFYQRLFELDPQLRSLFHNDIEEQSRKLMQFLRQLVESVDHPEDIIPALSHSAVGTQRMVSVKNTTRPLARRCSGLLDKCWVAASRQKLGRPGNGFM